MSERTIRLSEDTWQALQARSPADETLDETISRLLDATAGIDERDWNDDEIDDAVHEMTAELESDFEAH